MLGAAKSLQNSFTMSVKLKHQRHQVELDSQIAKKADGPLCVGGIEGKSLRTSAQPRIMR